MSPATDWQMIGIGALAVGVTALLVFVALLVSRGLVKRQSFKTLVLLLLGVGALALAMIYKDDLPQPQQQPQTQKRPRDGFPAEVAQFVVLKHLRDPNSATFGNINVYDDRKLKGKSVTVACGSVNSKNGFGGYSGAQKFIVLKEGYLAFFDNSEDNSAFVALWNGICAGKHS
jgi:hypothetical protein